MSRHTLQPLSSSFRGAFWARGVVLAAFCAVLGFGLQVSAEERFWIERNSPGAELHGPDLGSFAGLVKKVSPAVVNIDVEFGSSEHSKDSGKGQGSGFIITRDGYALTNHHVINRAREITVTLADDRKFPASVVGHDPSTDLALIKLQGAQNLKALPLGNSKKMSVGDWVLAMGSPLGLQKTVTMGIISATGRRDLKTGNRRFYSNFIQTDASINPGNSGGPLINTRGEVVGINTAINKEGQGIGFAIPINMAKTVLPALRKRGYVERSWMGIMIQELDTDLARSFGLKAPDGALITDVVANGPGKRAGLEAGDVILAFNGHSIGSSTELPWLASVAGVGETIPVKVWRGGKKKSFKLTLEPLPGQSAARNPSAKGKKRAEKRALTRTDHLGIVVKDLRQNKSNSGVLVVRIDSKSPARSSGLRPGDVIVEMGAEQIDNARSFYDGLLDAGQLVRVKVHRAGSTFFFAFRNP